MSLLIDIRAELETLIAPLAGTTQGEAVSLALRILSEQSELQKRIAELEADKAQWRAIAITLEESSDPKPWKIPVHLAARTFVRSHLSDAARKLEGSK